MIDQASLKAITAEYLAMKTFDLCEEEYATFAKEKQWRAERMLQLVCPPNEDAYWCIHLLFDDSNTAKEK